VTVRLELIDYVSCCSRPIGLLAFRHRIRVKVRVSVMVRVSIRTSWVVNFALFRFAARVKFTGRHGKCIVTI